MYRFPSKKIQNSGFFIVLNLLNTSIPFLILPFLLVYLTPMEMGILGSFNIVYDFFQNVIGLGTLTQIQKEFVTKARKDFIEFLLNGYVISIVFTGLINIIIISLPRELFGGILSKELIIVAVNGALFYQLGLGSLLIIQQKKNIKTYGVLIISGTLINFLLSLFLLKIEMGVLGRTIGIASAQLFLFITIRVLKLDGLDFQYGSYKNLILSLKQGLSFIPFQFSNWANKNLDKLVILNISTPEIFGAYTLGATLSRGVSLPISSVIQGLKPYNNDDLRDGNIKIIVKTSLYIFLFGITILVFASLLLDPLLSFIDRENNYHTYKYIFLLLFLGAALDSLLLYFKGIWIYLEKKSILNIQATINLVLALVFYLLSLKNIVLYIKLSIIVNILLLIHSRYFLTKFKV